MKLMNIVCNLCMLCCIDAYKVLVLFPFPMKSINILGEGLVRHLLKAGHEVTFATTYPIKDPPKKNFTQVDISSIQALFKDELLLDTSYVMDNVPKIDPYYVQLKALTGAIYAFNDTNFQKLLNDTSLKFDLVISDYIETELYAGVAAVFDCPLIWSYAMGPHAVALRLVGESVNPAYTVDYLTSNVVPFTLRERVQQLWAQIQWRYYKWFYTMPQEEALYKEFYGPYLTKRGRILPDYREVIFNASLVFSNEHLSIGNMPPVPLNFKFVGGFHIEEVPKPLPKNLQNILDKSKHGVIYFSLGSMWKSKDIPRSVTNGLLKLFGSLKQTVIWKYEEELQNMPPNLHIIQWAPQQSILAHPNVRIFLSHGGHLGIIEALHFGVPIIGIPVYFDHHTNMKKAVKKGYALSTSFDYNIHNTLRPLIEEMLNNPKYGEKAKELSWVYHHRLAAPGQEIVHWVEHVIHTGGALHLRSPALHMPFYQIYFLDIAFILFIFIAILGIALVISIISCKKSYKRREKKEK